MNWRLLTAINAAIALITLSSVIYVVSRPRSERPHTAARSNPTNEQNQAAEREAKARIEALADLSQARVDDLGSVPASELTHLMDRATPEQLAALALKFNDAPIDARTFGGMAVFFQAWTELDPKAALAGAFQLRDVTLRKLAATAVVNSVSPSAAPELIATVVEHPDKDLLSECKNTFLDPLIKTWSSLDPQAASQFVDELGDTKNSFNSTARDNIAYNWGTLDPEVALEWVGKQKGKDYIDNDSLTDDVIRGWCLKDIRAASDYVVQHLNDPASRATASSVAEAMFARSPEDATNWIGRLPEGDPRKAAEFAVASRWVDKDPTAAADWVTTLPETDQASVAGTIARSWVDTNWPEASRWIETLSGDARDSAVSAAMHRDGTTPQESLSLGASIKDDATRNFEMSEAIRQWTWNDPQAAETWVKGSSLPIEEQEQLLNVISDTRKAAADAAAPEQ
jgi:hypothetical protein